MNPSEHGILDLYLGSFAARHDAYVKESRAHIEAPLDPELAYAALGKGGFSVSGYMARWVSVADHEDPLADPVRHCLTHVGAIDFDMEDGFDQAKKVRATLAGLSIPSLLVSSRRGAHLWVTTVGHDVRNDSVVGMVPASIIRRALSAALTLTGIEDKKAEVFPKKSSSDWGVGALRMPLMRHPKTGVRYPAYDDDDNEIDRVGRLVQVMADVQAGTSFQRLHALAGPEVADVAYPSPSGPYRRSSVVTGDAPGVTELLGERFGAQAIPGRSMRCPFHDDHHASLQVAKDDERIWCKTDTCEMYNDGRGMGSLELAKYLTK